jgi:hypothetical protein
MDHTIGRILALMTFCIEIILRITELSVPLTLASGNPKIDLWLSSKPGWVMQANEGMSEGVIHCPLKVQANNE